MLFAGTSFPDTGFAFLKNCEGHLFPEFPTNVCCAIFTKPMCIFLSSCCRPGGTRGASHPGAPGPGPGREGEPGRGRSWEGLRVWGPRVRDRRNPCPSSVEMRGMVQRGWSLCEPQPWGLEVASVPGPGPRQQVLLYLELRRRCLQLSSFWLYRKA